MILVDTAIWSLALRRTSTQQEHIDVVAELQRLISSAEVTMIGAIRQELLSGIKHQTQFVKLRERLRAFPDLVVTQEQYELGAEYFNVCRRHGVQGSNTDFLLCAVAIYHQVSIFTTDQDFNHYQQYVPIQLHTY